MNHTLQPVRPTSPRKQLTLCISTLLLGSVATSSPAAEVWYVNSCDDSVSGDPSYSGTLRFAVANAASGDTVDLQALSCSGSKISLTTGSIEIAQDNLTIVGPGSSALQIDGSNDNPGLLGDYRILTHTGNGLLTLKNIGLTAGHVYHVAASYPSRGGCINSNGSLYLYGVVAHDCSASSNGDLALGGGIYAKGDVGLYGSTLTGNSAISGTSDAIGGGVYTTGKLTLSRSIISGNSANSSTSAAAGGGRMVDVDVTYSTISNNSTTGYSAIGGGILASGAAYISKSTISGNSAGGSIGGLALFGGNFLGKKLTILSSTISGNSAGGLVGGLYTDAGYSIVIASSTIAYNSAGSAKTATDYFGSGVAIGAKAADVHVEINNSILSSNTCGASEDDLSVAGYGITVKGASNLIRFSSASLSLPIDTQSGCPLLGPLRDNGGPTATHALMSSSPALDAGNIFFLFDGTDQRGSDYLRPSISLNTPAVVDIGAYEVQQYDVVFNTAFDGCSAPP